MNGIVFLQLGLGLLIFVSSIIDQQAKNVSESDANAKES